MDTNNPNQPLSRRIFRYIATENMAYWLTGAIVWVPWYFSDSAGMLAMHIMVPITIFFATLYGLKRVPLERWRKEIWVIMPTFILTCIIIDFFFWVIWRDYNAKEWYLPITKVGIGNFIGYIEMIITCYLTYILASKSRRVINLQKKLKFGDRFVLITGIILLLISILSATFFW